MTFQGALDAAVAGESDFLPLFPWVRHAAIACVPHWHRLEREETESPILFACDGSSHAALVP